MKRAGDENEQIAEDADLAIRAAAYPKRCKRICGCVLVSRYTDELRDIRYYNQVMDMVNCNPEFRMRDEQMRTIIAAAQR